MTIFKIMFFTYILKINIYWSSSTEKPKKKLIQKTGLSSLLNWKKLKNTEDILKI